VRILVHEFASGGGLAGRDVPPSLAREGAAMAAALIEDLAALRCHHIVTTADPRFRPNAPSDVEIVTLPPGRRGRDALLDRLIESVDAVWLVAPETGRCLERLAARVEQTGKVLLGSGAAAIHRASDKVALPRRLARHGVPHPPTRVLRSSSDWKREWLTVARGIGYPVVIKPGRGAACEGVSLARDARELRGATELARHAGGPGPMLLQRYMPGVHASVSLIADSRRAVPLAVNAQCVRISRRFSYHGGRTPFDHPLAERAIDACVRTCQAFPGLRGYVGIDVVLTDSEAVVIEVNPRLTTAYLGVRSALDGNVAALALAACGGVLPVLPQVRRSVRFTAAGRIVFDGEESSATA